MPADPGLDTRVRLHVYRRLVSTGRAPSASDIASGLGVSVAEVHSALKRLHEARTLVLKPGTTEVWMANPLSAVPTPFSVESDRHSLYGNCIWDAMGILAMLDVDGTVRTSCPDCDEPLEVRIESQSLASAAGVIHFAVPARHWWDDIGYT